MSLSHRYREFGPDTPDDGFDEPIRRSEVEAAKLEVFEEGYTAGWDDAVKAFENDQGKFSADLSQNLQDMSFTHHEAFVKLSTAMKPLFSQIIAKLLPEVARKSLGMHILTQLTELMEEQANGAIEIAVSPRNIYALQDLLEDQVEVPFALVSEPSLGAGQVYLRVNRTEREINLDAVISGISDALEAFFQQAEQEEDNE